MALGGIRGGVAVRVGGGSPSSALSAGNVSQRRSSPPAIEPEGSKPDNYNLGEVLEDQYLLSQILSHTKVDQINMLEKVNKAIKDNVFEYCKTKNVYRLDLSNVESAEKIHQLLMKIKDVDKIKITGLNIEGKFELFNLDLNSLSDVTFNTIQCDLSGNQLTENQFKEINTRLLSKMSRLTSLNLFNNKIGDAGAWAIAQSEHMSSLTSLNLEAINIKAEGATAIAKSQYMSNLTSLDLSENDIEAAGARAISESEHMSKLKSLNLYRNKIGDEGATAIAINLTKLTSLSLGYNNIGDEGATAIANSPHMSKLTSLDLCNNNIGAAGARAISESEHMSNLTSLSLGNNKIGDEGATALCTRYIYIICKFIWSYLWRCLGYKGI